MKIKYIILLIISCLFFLSCSNSNDYNDSDECSWLVYVANIYPMDICECPVEDLECESINIITQQQFLCMVDIESIDGCKYVDSSICSGIDFSGNIKSLNQVPCFLFE